MKVTKIKYKLHLDEDTENTICEALGVVNQVRDESLRIVAYVEEHIKDFEPKPEELFSQTACEIDVVLGESCLIPIKLTVFSFRNENDRKKYRSFYTHENPCYSKLNEEIKIEIDIVGNKFDSRSFLFYLQHEIHHAYQDYRRKLNGVKQIENSPNYDRAVTYLVHPFEDVRIASEAVYLYGTHEMSAYENGLYSKLLQNFKGENEPITNVIHNTPFFEMYVEILNMYRLLDSGQEPMHMKIIRDKYGFTAEKFKNVCGRVIKKSQDVMAKAVAKAKLDYCEWKEKESAVNTDPYQIKSGKPLKEEQFRITRKNGKK